MSQAIKEIEAVIQTYLDGLYEGDTAKLAAAFHDVSHLYAVDESGQVSDVPRAQWFDFVAGRASPRSKGLTRTDRIVSIDISGPETAAVKLECSVAPRYFTDYLLLLRLKEGWRIVSKSYRTEIRK